MSSQEVKEILRTTRKAANSLNNVSNMIPEAIKLNPSLKPELRLFDDEINSSKAVVDLIRNQSGLHTSGVIAGIRMLQSHSEIVMDDLDCLDDKVREDLKGMIDNFRAKRKTLAQQIRLVSVGLTKSDGAFKIKTNIVKSTNTAVKKVLGNDSGLVIASFLAKLNRDLDLANGEIRLSDREYANLQQIQMGPVDKQVTAEGKKRIICNCLARDQAIQILGPIAVDLWSEMALIKTEGLVAMGHAIQFGYPVTMEVFREGLDRQEKRVASSRAN